MHGHDTPIVRKCNCGNIEVSGNHFTRIWKTGLSETLQQVIGHNPDPLIQIRSSGVLIYNPNSTSMQRVSDTQCIIQCSKCKDSVLVILGRGNAFAQFKRKGTAHVDGFSSAIPVQIGTAPNSIPRLLRNLISFNEIHEDTLAQNNDEDDEDAISPVPHSTNLLQDDDNDDDFDIMFSNTKEAVVGSYTESSMAMTFF
ncbi:hypothetical protein TVAG_364330 [Trichomonas vaginalis G3]|uniref:Uncharacterized protein n=1 Tax=Trichomonas vaginalis (strain ATCC PRA-98 / G3) TaxID=412133 RepID=A2E9E5_TRIV3|nr:hypothetical protein TVAGG3_0000850 [Trichomonas vaginalis G3]EAY10709.1 hypothetical protein TVAG_364330 [Trichomonas vaginalis G3]KAI5538602.1 hypothetical protein TVAGG3_0000850 [Trichomonas vaginalis G3]|eukprot:XP_001322932.1 hypothetical protein [Trichomonas vaginalis G3]